MQFPSTQLASASTSFIRLCPVVKYQYFEPIYRLQLTRVDLGVKLRWCLCPRPFRPGGWMIPTPFRVLCSGDTSDSHSWTASCNTMDTMAGCTMMRSGLAASDNPASLTLQDCRDEPIIVCGGPPPCQKHRLHGQNWECTLC